MNIDLATIIMSAMSSLVVGLAGSWLALDRFRTKSEEHEKSLNEWRDCISSDVACLKRSTVFTELKLLEQSFETLDKKVEKLSSYAEGLKHLHIDSIEMEMVRLRQSVDRLEEEK